MSVVVLSAAALFALIVSAAALVVASVAFRLERALLAHTLTMERLAGQTPPPRVRPPGPRPVREAH